MKTNKRIQREVDKKNGSDLRDIADFSVSPNDYAVAVASPGVRDWAEAYVFGVEAGFELARKLAKFYKTNFAVGKTFKEMQANTYEADINDALGTCHLYFVGTVESILAKLKKLGNDNADPGATGRKLRGGRHAK